MKFRAPAKINLALDVLEKDACGYHKIQTVLHEISELYNELEFYEAQQVNDESIAQGPPKKALHLLRRNFKIPQTLAIKIVRNIPPSSGLGGESSLAAAVLKGANKILNLGLSDDRLRELAAELGMDVPFFIAGGTAFATHFGEKIQQLAPIKNIKFVIDIRSSQQPEKTAAAYASLDRSKCGRNTEKTTALLDAIASADAAAIIANIHNDFETLTAPSTLHLSGSGPSTFTAAFRRDDATIQRS